MKTFINKVFQRFLSVGMLKHVFLLVKPTSAPITPSPSYLSFSLDGFHPADELTVGLKQEQQLKVQLIQPPTQFQFLQTHSVREHEVLRPL